MNEGAEIREATQNEKAVSIRAFIFRCREDEEFRQRYELAFPENAIHVVALMANPKCDCLNKMIQNHLAHPDKLKEQFPAVMDDPEAILILPRSLIGEVVEIQSDKYKEFIHCLGKFGWQYRGLSVVPRDVPWLRIYFF